MYLSKTHRHTYAFLLLVYIRKPWIYFLKWCISNNEMHIKSLPTVSYFTPYQNAYLKRKELFFIACFRYSKYRMISSLSHTVYIILITDAILWWEHGIYGFPTIIDLKKIEKYYTNYSDLKRVSYKKWNSIWKLTTAHLLLSLRSIQFEIYIRSVTQKTICRMMEIVYLVKQVEK